MTEAIRRVRTLASHGETSATGMPGGGLPPDLLREASRRLGIIARFFIVAPLFAATVWHTVVLRFQVVWPTAALDAIAATAALLSLGVYLATRRRNVDPASIVTLGLAYEVALAALVAVANHVLASPAQMTVGPIVSRVTLILLAFPTFVPSTPRQTLVAAFIGASMDPVAMSVAIPARHLDVAPWHIVLMHVPNYVVVALAVLMSRIVTRLGLQVRDARDLGSYRLGALLGRGGMGEVYVAHHRMLARPAAIKLMRPEALEDRSAGQRRVAVERFRREAEAAANLRSAHTIELYDFGVSDDGVFYYVMELLDGADLERLVERFGPVPPDRAIHLLRQACDSLAEAHARGLIHRDIKPSNIYTCRMGLDVDVVKILDFGLVKPSPGRDADVLTLTTQDAATPGTPAFMAPEAVFGDPPPDHRADVYALGCVAYWLVTGGFVFEATTAARMLTQHLEAQPQPPSRRTKLDLPPELDAVILDCLAKRPDDRPASALEFARRLAACPVREPWTDERAHEWWNRHLPVGKPRDRVEPASRPLGFSAGLLLAEPKHRSRHAG